MSHRIGELSSDSELDGDFKVCNEDQIPNYYGMNTSFTGGKKAIKNEIIHELENLEFQHSGLISFRFIVNCEGNIGRFRALASDLNLENVEIDPNKLKTIEEALLKLKNWNPARNEYNTFDSYYVLNFKIRKNKIIDIF